MASVPRQLWWGALVWGDHTGRRDQMPQPPPPALQDVGPLKVADSDEEEPDAKVDRSRSVSLLSHSGQFIESAGADIDWRRTKTWPQALHLYS